MRQTNLSAAEIADMDDSKRREDRNRGLKAIPIRDRGYQKLSNGVGFYWHHPKRESEEVNGITTIATPKVPDNHFGVEIDGKMTVFDAEEFRKWLRWA